MTAAGFSIRIVWSGTTYSSGWPWLLREDRLVLVAEKDVALARGEVVSDSRALLS